MKIENLRREKKANRVRATATVTWEDCNRPTEDIYFEADESFADSLSCNPHAFLVAAAIPAMHYGEQRVSIDAEICPELRTGLLTALSWIRHWRYGARRDLLRIEAKTMSTVSNSGAGRAGFFFSGGIDSYATLRRNRLDYPLDHPRSIKDALVVYGLEIDEIQAFEHVSQLLANVAPHFDLVLIPVYTNLYLNYRREDAANHFDLWTYEFGGAALAAVSHAFARRLNLVSIAATFDVPNLGVWGTHPLLDPNYSSHDLQIRHDGIALSRLEKVRLVADWDVALQNLRVCNQFTQYRPRQLNCGRCEKCVRTMLELLAVGALERATAFGKANVTVEDVRRSASIHNAYVASCYTDLITPLASAGRPDLVSEIERRLARESRKNKIRHIDNAYFSGNLRRLKKRLSG